MIDSVMPGCLRMTAAVELAIQYTTPDTADMHYEYDSVYLTNPRKCRIILGNFKIRSRD